MIRRRPLLLALPLAGLGPADALRAAEPVVAIVSLAADQLTVTGFESTTGSKLDNNPQQRVPLAGSDLEKSLLRAGLRAVTEARAGKAVPLLLSDPGLYRAQDRLLDGGSVVLPASLIATLQEQKATRLLLVTKHRAEARMKGAEIDLGSGRVEGLGFYVDRVTRLRREGTSEIGIGYIAPHVYVRLSLVDVADGRVLGTRLVTASQVFVASSADRGADPWDLLDDRAKLQALNDLIQTNCVPEMRALLSS